MGSWACVVVKDRRVQFDSFRPQAFVQRSTVIAAVGQDTVALEAVTFGITVEPAHAR